MGRRRIWYVLALLLLAALTNIRAADTNAPTSTTRTNRSDAASPRSQSPAPGSSPRLQVRDPLKPWPRDPLVETAQPRLPDPNDLLQSGSTGPVSSVPQTSDDGTRKATSALAAPSQSSAPDLRGAQLPLRGAGPQTSTSEGGAGAPPHSEFGDQKSEVRGQGSRFTNSLSSETHQSPLTNAQFTTVLSSPNSQFTNSQLTTALPPALDDKHQLAIGDRLSFRILEDQEDPTEPREPKSLAVTDSGELEVPYVGRVAAENKTCKQLASEIKTALERDYYHQATVVLAIDLLAKSRGRVYLVGPVRVPGPQDIPSDEVLTLSKAIMRAGGFGDFADKRNVKVTRKGKAGDSDKKSFVIDVAEILEKGKVERDLPLRPDDFILVSERAIRF